MRYPEQPIRPALVPHTLLCRVVPCAGLFVVALCAGAPAYAQEEFTGLRSMGMGGANRAVASGNDAIYLNPAGMSLSRKYSIEGAYLYNNFGETHAPGVSVVDSVTSPGIAAGVAYSYVAGKKTLRTLGEGGLVLESPTDRSGNILHVGMSMPLGKNAAVGVAGKYLDLSYGGRSAISAVTVDAGLIFRPSPNVSVGVTGYGLTNTGTAEAPMQMGFGLALGPPGTFQLAVDWVMDFSSAKYNESVANRGAGSTKHQVFAGIEWTIAREFSLRAGYFHDRVTRENPDNALTFGLGYFSVKNRIGFQVGFQQRFQNTDDRVITAGIQLFI